MKITILGPPGSGKGTFASKLGTEFKVKVISVGDILREEVKNKTEVGKKIKDIMSKGKLLSDDLILEIVNKNIDSKDIVFDGFPRTMTQAEGVSMDRAINLVCNDELCIKRITNRITCSKCKKIYNLVTEKPKKEGICDVCGGELIGRADKKVVEERLNVFKKETSPIIKYYKKKGILVDVDAERSISEIYEDIRKIFKSKK